MKNIELSDAEFSDVEEVSRAFDANPKEILLLVTALLQSPEHSSQEPGSGKTLFLLDAIRKRLLESPPAIQHRPGVMGGVACVGNTRIPVWLLVSLKRQGATDGELLRAYPSLNAHDLSAAWSYFIAHSEEIEKDLQEESGDEEAVG